MTAAESMLTFLEQASHRRKRRRLACDLPTDDLDFLSKLAPEALAPVNDAKLAALSPAKRRKAEAYSLDAYDPELEAIQRDLSQESVNSGRNPANFVLGAELEHRFDEYPKLRRLLDLHSDLVEQHAHPSTRLATDLSTFDLSSLLPVRYDAILIDPPLTGPDAWSWADIEALNVPSIAANPSFIWLWVGSGCQDGLEKGRALLSKWGYRRCEDIVWLKTNKHSARSEQETGRNAVFTNAKEHCLMGIRGTVRRSTDAHYVHCNVDTDVVFAEEDPADPSAKPIEMVHFIENFCLGTRRIYLFAPPTFARPGWLALNPRFEAVEGAQDYDKATYDAYFDNSGTPYANVVPNTPEVDSLRPRTPPPPQQRNQPQVFVNRGPPAPAPRPPPAGPSHLPTGPAHLPMRPQLGYGQQPPPVSLPPRPNFAPVYQQQQPHYQHSSPQRPLPPAPAPMPAPAPVPSGPLDLDALASKFGGWSNVMAGAGRGRGGQR